MKSKRLIVLSLDALGSTDFEMFSQLPNFKKFIDHAAFCRQVRSVYPSLTYPAHTTIVTGRPPAEHGIVNNILIQPERSSPDWFWQRKYIQGTTLYDEALKKGMQVAALLWPVTAKSDITWNLPEIFANQVVESDHDIGGQWHIGVSVDPEPEVRQPQRRYSTAGPGQFCTGFHELYDQDLQTGYDVCTSDRSGYTAASFWCAFEGSPCGDRAT